MKRLFLAAAIAAFAVTHPLAQESPKPVEPQRMQPSSSTSLNVQFVLSRYQGDKKISSMPYMLGVLSNGPKTSLRIGTQVPVVTNVFSAKADGKEVPQQSYTYRDVGTNIDCQATSTTTGHFNLNVIVEDSSIHLDRGGDQKLPLRDVPAFRSFRASFSLQLREGQTMQYASATDPVSGEVMKIDVTLNVAK